MIDIQRIKSLPPPLSYAPSGPCVGSERGYCVAIKMWPLMSPSSTFSSIPVMPGVLIMEALAQTAGVSELSKPENKGKLVFLRWYG